MSLISHQNVLVIIPTFNRAHYLSEAVESVLAQDHCQKKIMIVDDGSTDGTRELCRAFMENHPEIITYVHKKNGGCSSARNKGLDAIDDSIDYVCFLDSDDRFLPGKLSREVRLLTENPDADFTYSDAIIFDTQTGIEKRQRAAAADDPGKFPIELFTTNEAKTSATMYRAGVVASVRFREDFMHNEDTHFLQNIAMQHKAVYADQPGTWVRWHDGSKSRNTIEILKAVIKSNQELILAYPAFHVEHMEKIDAHAKRTRRHLAVELLLNRRFSEVPQYTDDSFLLLQSTLRLPYFHQSRRRVSAFINRHFK